MSDTYLSIGNGAAFSSTSLNPYNQNEESQSVYFDEILLHIFQFVGVKDLDTLKLVSKQFSRVAKDERLWRIFCQKFFDCSFHTQSNSQNVDSYALYHQLPSNIRSNRFVYKRENYPKETYFMDYSGGLICIAYEDKIAIHHPGSDTPAFILDNPYPTKTIETLNSILEIREKVLNLLSKKQNDFYKREIISELLKIKELLFQKEILDLFESYTKTINLEYVDFGELQVELDKLKLFFSRFIEHMKFFNHEVETNKRRPQVQSFAVSELYIAVFFSSQVMEVWDRKGNKKIISIGLQHLDNTKIAFIENELYYHNIRTKEILKIDIKGRNIITVNKEGYAIFKKINDHSLIIGKSFLNTGNYNYYIWDVSTREKHQIGDCTMCILDAHYDTQTERLALIKWGNNTHDNSYQLIVCQMGKNLVVDWEHRITKLLPFACDVVQWRHGYLWVGRQGGQELLKLDPSQNFQNINMVMPLQSVQMDWYFREKGFSAWINEKFVMFSEHRGAKALDFSESRREILQNMGKNLDALTYPPINLLQTRFSHLNEKDREGIKCCLNLLGIQHFEEARSEEKRLAVIQTYLQFEEVLSTKKGQVIFKVAVCSLGILFAHLLYERKRAHK